MIVRDVIDDAVYCEHPDANDPELAYIPYWRHVLLATKDRIKLKRVTAALIVAVVLLIGSNAAWYFLR